MKIQRNSIADMASKYEKTIGATPRTGEGTDTDRTSAVGYLRVLPDVLLQKREEDFHVAGIDRRQGKDHRACSLRTDKVSPKGMIALLIAFILGVAIPAGIIYLRELLRNKILGHDDVEKLTQLPIIGRHPDCQRQRKQGQYRDNRKTRKATLCRKYSED